MQKLIAAVFLIGVAAGATAQERPAPAVPPAIPRWEAGGNGVGVLLVNVNPNDGRYRALEWGDTGVAARGLFLGRFLTTHVKVELRATFSSLHGTDAYAPPNLPERTDVFTGLKEAGTAFVDRTERHLMVSPAVTYQFFDNACTHPYVSAGVSVDWRRQHRVEQALVYTIDRVAYPVPAIDERNDSLLARPFVAAGYTFYFSTRLFVRPEALLSFAPRGRIYSVGLGSDF